MTKSKAKVLPPVAELGIAVASAQWRMSLVWLLGVVAGLGTLMWQTILGAYLDNAKEAWALMTPLYVSILSILLGALASNAIVQTDAGPERVVLRSYYRVCLLLSVGANIAYVGSLWLQPVMILHGMAASPYDALKTAMLWMLPVQGIVSIALGGLLGASRAGKQRT